MDSLRALLPFVLILVAFYMLIIRPARKRQSAKTRLQDNLQPGQQVMTTSGMYAEIVAFDGDAVLLETSPGVRQRWAKAAVARIVPENETEPAAAAETDAPTDTDIPPDTDTQNDTDTTGKRPG